MAQAGRRWQRTLFPWMLAQGFVRSDADPCLFVKNQTVDTPDGPRVERLYVGCYIDDLCCVYDHDDEHSLYSQFVRALDDSWDVEDEGELTDLLGVEFEFGEGHVTLRQSSYIRQMVATYFPDGLPSQYQTNRVPAGKSLESHVHAATDAKLAGATVCPRLLTRYQSLVGALLYCATNTRPDISFAVGYLCRAMSCPTPELMCDAERVLGYLARAPELGLRYQPDQAAMHGYSDSDWAVRHSTSGYSHVHVLDGYD